MPLIHCVFLKFRPEITVAQKAEIYSEIAALQGRLDGLMAVDIGDNLSPEGLDKGHSEGFMVTFADSAARDRYLADPEHQKTGAKIVAATEGGLAGVFVYDLSVR